MAAAPSEEKLAIARASKSKQDQPQKFLIHVENGRLLPNIAMLRSHAKLRVFHGDPKASAKERLKYLESQHGHRSVVNTVVDSEPFDIGKATKDELIEFAASEYGISLNEKAPIAALRKQVSDAAASVGAPGAASDSLG